MKKLCVFICCIFFIQGCTAYNLNPSTFNILGEYLCANEEFNNEFFIKNPDYIPSITFYDNGSCKAHVNYLEGIIDVLGYYSIEGNLIHVNLNIDDSVFYNSETGEKYIDDQFIFTIVDDNKIILDGDFYSVGSGEIFVKKI